jgi:hypothetical protein
MTKTLGILSLAMTLLPLHAQHKVTLDAMRDRNRPVLVFAPSESPQVTEQLRILTRAADDLHERDVLVVPILLKPSSSNNSNTLSPEDQTAARRRFHIHPNDFTVILLGKDGTEKLRSHHPISLETLRSTIDAMPMRQDEMRSQQPPK